MKPILNSQIAAFNALLKQHNITDQKADIVQQLSNGRATSTKDLYAEEIQPWIDAMNKLKPQTAHLAMDIPQQKDRQKMINSLIAMAREMGVIERRTMATQCGLHVTSDYKKFNEWLLTKSTCKKATLNDVTYEELPALVTQYKAIYMSWVRRFR